MGKHTSRTLTLRVDVPKYAELLLKADSKGVSLNKYVVDKIDNDDIENDIKSLEQIVEEQKKQIISFKAEKEKLSKELQKKPKEVIKEVPVKVENKAKLDDLTKKYTKDLKEQNNKLKTHITELKAMNDKIYKLETSLKGEKSANKDLSNKIKALDQKYKNAFNRVQELTKFINSLDLRKHDDGYSIGGRVLSEGIPVEVKNIE